MKARVTRAEGRCCIGCGQAFNSTRKVADWQTVREYPRAEGAKAITTGPVCIDCALARREPAVVPDEASSHHHYRVDLAEGVAVEFTAPAIRARVAVRMAPGHPGAHHPGHAGAVPRGARHLSPASQGGVRTGVRPDRGI